jgi:hypothetical protein
MIKVNQIPGYTELVWNCDSCGKEKILSHNNSDDFVAVSFEQPLVMKCCGNTETIGHVEAIKQGDGRFSIIK